MLPRLSLLTLALLNAHAYGAPALFANDRDYPNRVTGQFLTGDDHQLGGFADGMIPLMQNKDRLFFADGTFMLGHYQRSMYSGGLGYRQMADTKIGKGIWGIYGFADYYQTALQNGFWQLNPGVEWLNENYEFRLQGYIPVNSRSAVHQNTLASLLPAQVIEDSAQNISAINFATGHQVFDTPVNWLEESGAGVELEGGRFFNYGKGFWLRVGGYHFDYQTAKNINGVEGNIEIAMTKGASLLLQNNYDNQNKNQFSVGIRVNLGGSPEPIGTLEQRMTSPIIRHLARQSYGEAAPTRQSFEATGDTFLAHDNVWFFSPYGMAPKGALTTFADCTAEHPCSIINSPTALKIETISPDANFFFESGSYALTPEINGAHWVSLQDGQSIWGRKTGWLQAANGYDRPLMNGGLYWGGAINSANGAVYDMRVFNDNQIIPGGGTAYGFDARIGVGASGLIFVNNSDIRVLASGNSSGFSDALGVYGETNALINGSTINVDHAGNGAQLFSAGVYAENATVSNSIASVNSLALAARGTSTGIYVISNGNVSNSQISVTGVASGNNASYGVSSDTSNVTLTNSRMTVTGVAGSDNSTYGLSGIIITSSNNQMLVAGVAGANNETFAINGLYSTVTNNQLIVRGTAANSNQSVGVIGVNAASVNYSQITLAGVAGNTNFSSGAQSNIAVTVNNSQLSVSGASVGNNQSYGVLSLTNLTVDNSTISLNGASSSDNFSAGMYALNDVAVNNSRVSATGIANGLNRNTGIYADNGIVTLGNTTASSQGSSAAGTSEVFGVRGDNGIVFTGGASSISASAISGPASFVTAVLGPVTNTNGSQCTTNGNTVTCV